MSTKRLNGKQRAAAFFGAALLVTALAGGWGLLGWLAVRDASAQVRLFGGSVTTPTNAVYYMVRQKNSWVDSGSGSLPSE